jgi:F0F1-type ATP synthase beta subunit
MNNLDIVLALFTTPYHRFSHLDTTAAFQAQYKCNFELGLAELFPNIKPMSSTSKTVLNSYD